MRNWKNIPDHLYRILIIGGSGSGKTNALLNVINNQADTDEDFFLKMILMNQSVNFYQHT